MAGHSLVVRHRARRAGPLAAIGIALVLAVPGPVTSAPNPVLLVHGLNGSPSSFSTLQATLRGQGRTVEAIALPGNDNVANASAIASFVSSRGWARFDLVAHSMGGTSGRYFAKFLDGHRKIGAYVSLGTPQYGVYALCALAQKQGGQLCPGSGFLTKLNRNDDTRGKPAYTTIYSTSDGLVPTDSSRLDGGACHVQVSGVDHSGLLTSASVAALVTAALDGRCPGTFRP